MAVQDKNTAAQNFQSGYDSVLTNQGVSIGSYGADNYVKTIADACQTLEDDLNAFEGYKTDVAQLKGDVAEFWHADTFNINSALNQSSFKAVVDRSHDYASPDVGITQGDTVVEKIGLKVLRDARSSANAQSISHFQRFCQYRTSSGRADLTFEKFLQERNISPEDVLQNDPIYIGQTRIIPSDQLKEAIAFLERKIAREEIINPEQVKRYKDTLNHLQSRLKAEDGTESQDLSTAEALEKARQAQEGIYKAAEDGFTTEDLVQFKHILKQGLKAGKTSAVITFVLKLGPDLYSFFYGLISKGDVDAGDLRERGLSALDATTTSFVRGFVAASITTTCESGLLGESLKQLSPGVIAGLTTILLNTMSDTIKFTTGKISQGELSYNLSRNIFVTSCAIGLGSLTQVLIPLSFAYLLGNFVGSILASFAFTQLDSVMLSFCINSGCTFFGLVEQDYVLPDEVIKEIGIDVFDYEDCFYEEFSPQVFVPDMISIDEMDTVMIHIVRRGVIGVHKIGYQYL